MAVKKIPSSSVVLWIGAKFTTDSFFEISISENSISPSRENRTEGGHHRKIQSEIYHWSLQDILKNDLENLCEQLPHVLSEVSSVIFNLNETSITKENWPLFEKVGSRFSMSSLLFLLNETRLQNLEKIINTFPSAHILKWPSEENLFPETFKEMMRNHFLLKEQLLLSKQSSERNRKLEALTRTLEKTVQERTHYLSESTREEEDKLNKQKQTVKFVKELSHCQTEEEILAILRKELKKFHKLREPILWLSTNSAQHQLITFISGHYHHSQLEIDVHRLGIGPLVSAEGLEILANHFQRPFIRTFQISFNQGYRPFRICIEADIHEGEIQTLFEFLQERLQFLSVAYDRIYFESQLANFSYRWENTFDNISDPIAIIDPQFEIVRANKAFYKSSIQGKCYQIFAGKNEKCESCPLQKGETVNPTQQLRAGPRIYQVFSYPIQTTEPRSTQNQLRSENQSLFVNHYIDITDSRDLYLRVLQNEKISAIGLLAGNIAHELNNPLTGIKSLVQVLKAELTFQSSSQIDGKNPADHTAVRDLSEIEKSADRCQKIIHNLLEFSSAEEGQVHTISFDEVIEKTLPMLKSVTRYFETHLSLKASGAQVAIEPHLVQQVIFNIVNNACQAMDKKGRISIQSSLEDQNWATLRISDTGPGIPEDLRSKIFEPFFTTKQEGVGTGLGLSMSKQILDHYHGSLELETELGSGTTFIIRLPVVRGPS